MRPCFAWIVRALRKRPNRRKAEQYMTAGSRVTVYDEEKAAKCSKRGFLILFDIRLGCWQARA